MSIGETLAQARRWAGLSVTEVSQRTRIRETLVKDIERDDYSGCGGDFYTRGHIRAIARAVGADPEPLIDEYDAARRPPPEEPEAEPLQQFTFARPRGWQRQEPPGGQGSPGGQEPHGGQQRPEPGGWSQRQDPPIEPGAEAPRRVAPGDPDVRIMSGGWGKPAAPAPQADRVPPAGPGERVTPASPGERFQAAGP